MTQLITYKRAKEEAKRLHHYVSLVESYSNGHLRQNDYQRLCADQQHEENG
jgi:hypothetical protein